MKPADRVRRFLRRAGVTTHSATDDAVFENLKTAYTEMRETRPAPQGPTIWRTIMNSPKVKLSMAAVLLLAGVAAVSFWQGTGSGIALADVLTRIQQVGAYRYQVDTTVVESESDRKDRRREIQTTCLISQGLGKKITTQETDMTFGNGTSTLEEVYILPRQRIIVEVKPIEKTYRRTELNDTRLQELRQEVDKDPGYAVKEILDCDYTSLGRSTLDGKTVEVFHSTDPKLLRGQTGTIEVTMWVDVKTHLPVRDESTMGMELAGGLKATLRTVMHDFQWGISIDAGEFNPTLADDFRDLSRDPVKLPIMAEEDAIESLRRFAELAGRYPRVLTDPNYREEMGRLMDQLLANNPPASDRSRQEWGREDRGQPFASRNFYQLLTMMQLEPAYHGDTVTPQDATEVLMRWKVADNQYRVIFGNLSAQTVDAATLAELEKTLPK
jgi:hypothetical protein